MDGKPFFLLADTAWELFHRLKDDEAAWYLEKRAAQGFNVIFAVALAEFDLSVPDPYGNLQLHDNDPTKPNEAYFARIDAIVKKAGDLGLYIGFLPTWGDKWNKVRLGQGPRDLHPGKCPRLRRVAGQALRGCAALFGSSVVTAPCRLTRIAPSSAPWPDGLRQGDGGKHLITFHPNGSHNSADFWPDEPWLDFHMFQSGHGKAKDKPNYEVNLRNRALKPVKPTLDGEPRYEDHPVRGIKPEASVWYDAFDVRQAAWWDVMSGSCGHTYGDHNIWQFLSPAHEPIFHARTPWQQAIDHDGAKQMGYMRAFFEKMDWQKLEPRDDILVGDKGEGGSRMLAMMSPEGDNVVVYTPHGKAVHIDPPAS